MVFNATFNNISDISWRLVLLVEETGENPVLSQVTDELYHRMVHLVHLATNGIGTHNFSDDMNWHTGSCKFNYHTITTTTAPFYIYIIPALRSPALGSVIVDDLGLTWVRKMVDSIPYSVNTIHINLIFTDSLLTTYHKGGRAKTIGLKVGIMCLSGVRCLPTSLHHANSNPACWSMVQYRNHRVIKKYRAPPCYSAKELPDSLIWVF